MLFISRVCLMSQSWENVARLACMIIYVSIFEKRGNFVQNIRLQTWFVSSLGLLLHRSIRSLSKL